MTTEAVATATESEVDLYTYRFAVVRNNGCTDLTRPVLPTTGLWVEGTNVRHNALLFAFGA